MRNFNFQTIPYAPPIEIKSDVLVAATPKTVATFDIGAITQLTISVAVAVAALTGLTFYARGDTNAQWIPLNIADLGHGRTDSSADVTTTPAGQSGVVVINTGMWAQVRVDATSAGAAALSITAGYK